MRPGMLEGGGGGMMMGLERPLEPPPPGAGHHPHNIMVSSHTPSISSGASTVGGGRVRFVRLIRRRNETYGFSLRGGREHGTGFFISHVEPGSEAHMQGLRAGDQVLRVNNLGIDQAIHREVTAMVQSKSSVILKVKSAGIIPVKEHRGDPLTWLVVDDDDEEDLSDHIADTYSQSLPSSSSVHDGDLPAFHPSASPAASGSSHSGSSRSGSSHSGSSHLGSSHTLANPSANEGHARVIIACGGKMGLGCSICKGPPEKPGIFVQSVRAGGVARTAGLRPGDQILACNDISFTHLEFAEAVYVLKSSPRLALDVLRGAGLDFVAGESSGYNSSASSVAGDQTPPSSSSDPRDSDHSVTSRLSAVSHHLTLDRSRGWREIEAEWADAEAAEKRRQLQSAQKTLKTRAQRDASHRLSSMGSRSLGNLSAALREEENEEITAFRDGGITSYAHSPPSKPSSQHLSPTHAHYKPTLRSTRSSSDVTDDTSHKIALVTSADPHVNNIVVTGGPKDEKDAVSRLEQLSSPSASRTSTLSSGASQVTVRSSSGSLSSAAGGSGSNSSKSVSPRVQESIVEQQLRELREEQRRLQEEANRLAEERRKFEEEKRRGVERTQSAPLAPLVINCSGHSLPPHLQQSPPSPTSSIASGRHTTRVLIKSPPPPPPPRKNTTTLSSRQSHPHQVSPPASPAHSSSSSSGLGSLCGSGAPPRRCKSIGSLSASSSESAVWEDLPGSHLSSSINHSHCTFRSNMPPPPPPKPTAPLTTQVNTNESKVLGGVPPPPPPPPPQSLSNNPQPSLAAALTKELERRNAKEAQASINGHDDIKGKLIQDKIDAYKVDKRKSVPSDPKRAQHDKLMEEFKLAHRRMFDSKDVPGEEEKLIAKVQNHQKVTKTTSSNVEFSSKIISRMNQSTSGNSINSKKPVPSIPNGNAVMNSNSKPNHIIDDGSTTVYKWKEMLNSVPAANKSNSISSSTPQQQNEWSGGSTQKPSVVMKSPLRPTPGKVVVIEDYKPVEKSSSPVWPPSSNSNASQERNGKFGKPAVEEHKALEKSATTAWSPSSNANAQQEKPGKSGKPLISIGTYPSPNSRPTPVKMDFLPSTTSTNIEVNGTSRFTGPTREDLQTELTSTLTRSNIRQRLSAQELPLESPSPSMSSSISESESTPGSIVNGGFRTTIVHNNNSGPMASLSTKYKGIGQDASSATNSEGGNGRKESDEPESLPTGILKPSGPSTSIRPLQKSISFGDVTTVGEDDCR